MTTTATASRRDGRTGRADEPIAQIRRRVLQVLMDGPRGGMPVWGHHGVEQGLPGRWKGSLVWMISRLAEDGIVEWVPTRYQGRDCRKVRICDPASVVDVGYVRRRDPETGRYVSADDNGVGA